MCVCVCLCVRWTLGKQQTGYNLLPEKTRRLARFIRGGNKTHYGSNPQSHDHDREWRTRELFLFLKAWRRRARRRWERTRWIWCEVRVWSTNKTFIKSHTHTLYSAQSDPLSETRLVPVIPVCIVIKKKPQFYLLYFINKHVIRDGNDLHQESGTDSYQHSRLVNRFCLPLVIEMTKLGSIKVVSNSEIKPNVYFII